MGYTHYWDQHTDFNSLQWKNLCGFVKTGVNLLNKGEHNVVCNGLGETWSFPTITKTEIVFNGRGAEACDTFVLEREKLEPQAYQHDDPQYVGTPYVPRFNCAKTRMKPYDVMVTATLLYAAEFENDGKQPVLIVSTDGAPQDWWAGVELYNLIIEEIKKTGVSFERYGSKSVLLKRVFGPDCKIH